MLRILYMSDLHLEMERWFLAKPKRNAGHPARGPLLEGIAGIDLVVMAGDIHNGLRGIVYAEQVAKYLDAPVVAVAGNHEFYNQDMARLLPASATAAAHSKGEVYFLENDSVSFTIRGRTLNVLGCTLWTDYALQGEPESAMRYAGQYMNDHAYIKLHGKTFWPEDALAKHRDSKVFLQKALIRLHKNNPDAVNLMVTHHAPCPAVLGERTGAIAPAYASALLAEFCDPRPAAWIHGHTHFRHESVQEGIRLVSAPRGYAVDDGAYQPGLLEL